jgi:hypothetical protein
VRQQEAYRAGLEGNRPRFLQELTDKRTSRDIAEDVVAVGTGEQQRLGQDVGRMRKQLRETDMPLDVAPASGTRPWRIEDIKQELIGDISEGGKGGILREDYNIRITESPNGKYLMPRGETSSRVNIELPFNIEAESTADFSRALQALIELPSSATAAQVDEMVKGLRSLRMPSRTGGAALGDVGTRLRERLGDVEGYDEPMRPFSEYQDFRKEVKENLGQDIVTEGPGGKEVNPRQLGASLLRGMDERRRVEYGTLQDIEARFPQLRDLRARVAAEGLQDVMPTGLIGRGGVVAAATGAGVAGATVGPLAAVAALPVAAVLFSPKVSARWMAKRGLRTRQVNQIADDVRYLAAEASNRGIPIQKATTIGELYMRLQSDENRTPAPQPLNTMGRLGQYATSFLTPQP